MNRLSLFFLATLALAFSAKAYSESTLQNSLLFEQKTRKSFLELMGEPKTQFSKSDTDEMSLLAMDYDINISSMTSQPLNHIPKQIHVIWVGPKPFPEKSINNMYSWQKNHPEWTINFWTDHTERSVPIPGMVKRSVQDYDFLKLAPFITKSTNWAEKADMMRYVILYREGGVYTDHDMWCEQSVEPLSNHFDFVAGCDPSQPHPGIKSNLFINNSILFSRPQHPILAQTIDQILLGCEATTKLISKTDQKNSLEQVMLKTVAPFLDSIKQFRNQNNNRDIVLPTIYLYAHNVFSKDTYEQLRSEGYVFAIHKHGN